MGRSPCCSKVGLNRGAWTALEDQILTDYIQTHGEGRWRSLPKRAGLKRCGKSCRLRWLNYLRPDIKRGNISADEEELIIRLHRLLGNRWSLIAGRLPGRTDNEIKNYWNTNLGKKSKKAPAAAAAAAAAASSQPPVRTKAARCTRAVVEMPRPSRGEPGIPAGAAAAVGDCAVPGCEGSTRPPHPSAGPKGSVDDLSFAELFNCFDFSICDDPDRKNSEGGAPDLFGSSPPSICSDDSTGIMLSQREMEVMMEDWLVSADACLLGAGGDSMY